MRHWVRSDKGNILIMMAGAMAVLAGFGILTIDIGRMLVTRTQLQNGADAAARGGASLYCSGQPTEAEVKAEAKMVGDANQALENAAIDLDIPYEDIVITETGMNHDVTVTTRSDTRQFLLGLFAIFQNSDPTVPDAQTDANVTAIATARCGATCGPNCVKPWSPPDRWDDVTGIPGYMGERRGRSVNPDWRNNGVWDHETIRNDANGNGLYDQGEPYDDNNGNGQYDEEFYHPSLTGYGPDPVPGNTLSPEGDLGLQLVLKFDIGGGNTLTPPGQYQAIRLPPINKGTPVPGADEYRENIERCNQSSIEQGDWLELETGAMAGPTDQGMEDLIRKDPDAYWDPSTQSIQDSRFAVSPRIVLIPIYDPRIPVLSGHQGAIQVVKVAAFFMEEMVGNAEVRGRFIKVRAPGRPCEDGEISFMYNLALIQ